MNYPDASEFETTFSSICVQEFHRSPERELLRFKHSVAHKLATVADVMERAVVYSDKLLENDVKPGDVVAVMLDNHPDHVAVMIALALTGAVWLPLDRRFTASNVRRVLSQVEAVAAIIEPAYSNLVREANFERSLIERSHAQEPDTTPKRVYSDLELQDRLDRLISTAALSPNDTRALLFTSGTTGIPKGVVVTERMFIASARFCGHASNATANAVYYLWEPLNHIGGAQIIPMAFLSGSTIAMTEKFSVSRYWSEVIELKATRLHYLGGVLELLLRQKVSTLDKTHGVTLGFGAGASKKISKAFTERFGIPLREVYGMTEASSFTTMNFEGPISSIGKTLPDFDLVLLSQDKQPVDIGEVGEIAIKPTRSALITANYYKNDAATESAFSNGYFHTGDLATQDESGYLYFVGRMKELIRCKGENISPHEVESVFKQHAAVLEVAVVGVESQVTEQDIAAFIRLQNMDEDQRQLVKQEIKLLLERELAVFQRPAYIVEIKQFPKTPSERIEKHKLDVSQSVLDTSWD